jgi:hypothetical protein
MNHVAYQLPLIYTLFQNSSMHCRATQRPPRDTTYLLLKPLLIFNALLALVTALQTGLMLVLLKALRAAISATLNTASASECLFIR